MGSLRLAFLRTVRVANEHDKNDVATEDHIVMEMPQDELMAEFKAIMDRHLHGKKAYTKQDVWMAIDHSAVDLVADFKKKSVRIL
jgi:hypothetical protein